VSAAAVAHYDHNHDDFASAAEATVRREAFGRDLGQSGWSTAAELLSFANQLRVGPGADVLEVGSGSGGPAMYLAEARGYRLTGVDTNELAVRKGNALADERGLSDRVRFRAVEADQPLPFDAGRFDAIISTDTIAHIRNRLAAFREWNRVLRPGGRVVFTDGSVLTGPMAKEELAVRSTTGSFFFLPDGENERLLKKAGFAVLDVEDVTQSVADVARRWHLARSRYRDQLIVREGRISFEGLQRFLWCVHVVSTERRLSRFAYLAEEA
jgi:SAM-dependent methyltransferase